MKRTAARGLVTKSGALAGAMSVLALAAVAGAPAATASSKSPAQQCADQGGTWIPAADDDFDNDGIENDLDSDDDNDSKPD